MPAHKNTKPDIPLIYNSFLHKKVCIVDLYTNIKPLENQGHQNTQVSLAKYQNALIEQ